MLNDLTNLLPPERRHALARAYLFRVGTVALLLVASVIAVHGLLLLPSYLYMQERIAIAEGRLAELSERRAISGFEDLSTRIAAFTERAAVIQNLSQTPSAADTIRSVLEIPQRGILLSSFSYTPPKPDGEGGTMLLRGTALTRESLRAFDSALDALPLVDSTDLPLSVYAQEADIDFSIALTLTDPTP